MIQCGGSKRSTDKAVPIWSLYTGTLWSTYRKARERREGALVSGPHQGLDVYVLSAEHGLLPESARCSVYDRVLVADTHRSLTKKGVPVRRVGDLVDTVRDQARRRGLTEVWFVGGATYRDLLRRAGLLVHDLERGGIGMKAAAVKRFVGQAPVLDLDALLARIED